MRNGSGPLRDGEYSGNFMHPFLPIKGFTVRGNEILIVIPSRYSIYDHDAEKAYEYKISERSIKLTSKQGRTSVYSFERTGGDTFLIDGVECKTDSAVTE